MCGFVNVSLNRCLYPVLKSADFLTSWAKHINIQGTFIKNSVSLWFSVHYAKTSNQLKSNAQLVVYIFCPVKRDEMFAWSRNT